MTYSKEGPRPAGILPRAQLVDMVEEETTFDNHRDIKSLNRLLQFRSRKLLLGRAVQVELLHRSPGNSLDMADLLRLLASIAVHGESVYLVEATDQTPEILVADALGDVSVGHLVKTLLE